jgi:hypothetical protein
MHREQLAMPMSTIVNLSQEEPGQMLAALPQARYGNVLALHILLVGAVGHRPTDTAVGLFPVAC